MIPDELKRARPLSGKERLGANRDSEYMGAEDIDPGTEPVLTIDHIYNAMVTLQRGKEQKDVITFREESVNGIKNVRPLIVNSTNRKTLRKLYKAVTAENLEGKRVQLYLDPNVRDPSTGDKIDGIRIRQRVPSVPRTEPIICEDCGKPITGTGKFTAEDIAAMAMKKYDGKKLCIACGQKRNAEIEAAKAAAEQNTTDDSVTNNTEEETSNG